MSWNEVKLGDFLKVRDNRYKPNDNAIAHLKRIDKIDFSGKIFISDKPSNTDMILVKKGDLVISGINVEKGAMAVYTGEEDVTATIHYSSYYFDESKTDIEFLKSFLKSIEFKNALKEQVPGGIKTEIKPKHILPLVVKIPTDIKDQREVVKLLKDRNSKVDAITGELTHQLAIVKKLRQQLLQDAVQGKLVPQDPKDEPASELLKRIKTEKAKLVAVKKIKKEKELPPIKPEEIPFEIPKGWVWCRLGEVCIINPRNKIDENIEAGFIPMPLISQKYNETPKFVVKKWHEIKSGFTHFSNDDVVVAKITPCFENSKAGIMKNLPNGIGAGTTELHVIRGNGLVNSKFIYAFIKAPDFLVNGERIMKGVAGQQRVPTEYFYDTCFPLPPLNEQNRIVNKLDELMQYCSQLEVSIKESQEQNEKLLQQVLREALRTS